MAFSEAATLFDSFNRANNLVRVGQAQWSVAGIAAAVNELRIISEKLAVTGAFANGRSTANFGPDVEQYIEVSSLPGSSEGYLFMAARIREAGSAAWDGYGLIVIRTGASTYVWQLRRYTNNSSTVLGANVSTKALATGGQIGFSVVGSVLKAFYKPPAGAWEELGSREDTTYTEAGLVGLELGDVTGRYDNYNVGTVGGDVMIVVPAAGAIASAPVAVPNIASGAFAAQAVANSTPPVPIIAPVSPVGPAVASGQAPAPEIRPVASAGAAIASSAAPTPAIEPAPPAAAAEASSAAPSPRVTPIAPPAGAVAAAPVAVPIVSPRPSAAAAIAGAPAPTPAIRLVATAAAAVASATAPLIETVAVLIPAYWQARARLLLGAAHAFFSGVGATATIAPTPKPVAVFGATPTPRAVFGAPTPRAKFSSGSPRAVIGDPDQTATIVT